MLNWTGQDGRAHILVFTYAVQAVLQLYLKLDKSSRKREWVGGWGGGEGVVHLPLPNNNTDFPFTK